MSSSKNPKRGHRESHSSQIRTTSASYTALTHETIRQHQLEQLSLHCNATCIPTLQQEVVTRLETALDSLGTRLPPYLYTKIVQDEVGLTSMERLQYQTSTHPNHQCHNQETGALPHSSPAFPLYTIPQQYTTQGNGVLPQSSPTATSYTMSQQYSTSALTYLPSSEDVDAYTKDYPETFAYHPSHPGTYLQTTRQTVAGSGTQFDSQKYPDYEEPIFFTKCGEPIYLTERRRH